ncbi:MAG: cobalt ECF transporter T component CbiQ [Tissierellia bacterium]|nr:cobalt ECF transporter T component CbiQ [Tissierellia bacterium]
MYLVYLKGEIQLLLIDKYAYNNRLVNSNPFIKSLIVLIALSVSIITKNYYINLVFFMMMMFLTVVVAGIHIDKYLRILLIPMTFLLISLVTILISISKVDLFLWSMEFFDYYIGVTENSINEVMLLTTRVFASISSTFFLALTTPLNHIIKVFKKIRIPDFVIELMVLIYRFIFVFLEESQEIYNGQEMKFGYSNLKNSYNSISLLIRSLFTRLILRYKDMLIVLECKLYDGEFKTGD